MAVNYRNIFKQAHIADHFERMGYAIIPNADAHLLTQLKLIHREFLTNPINGLYASHNENSFEKNKAISDKILESGKTLFSKQFKNIKYILGHYMIKAQSTVDEFQLHQDWSVTNERMNFSAHLWIPLQDTNRKNGTMFVIPGSHLFYENYRSGSLDIPRINRDKTIDKMIKPINVKKGECLIYHPALFHGSFANQSKKDRIAVLISLGEAKDQLKYYQQSENDINSIDVYEISPEIILQELVDLEKGQVPKNKTLIETIQHKQLPNKELSAKMVYDKFTANKSIDNKIVGQQSFLKKLFSK